MWMYPSIGIFLYRHTLSFLLSRFLISLISSPPLQKKTGVVKVQEKKERWKEKKVAKRQKKDDEEVEEEEENVQPVVDALENGFLHHAQREQERMNERLLKKTYSKKNKMVSVSASVMKEMSTIAAYAMNDRGANQLLIWFHFIAELGLKLRSRLFSKYISIHSILWTGPHTCCTSDVTYCRVSRDFVPKCWGYHFSPPYQCSVESHLTFQRCITSFLFFCFFFSTNARFFC